MISRARNRPGVLYIGGWGRSGSTLLALLLGQVPGLASVGELREVWQRGLVENGTCGCGLAFRACPFWTQVGQAAFGGWDRLDLEATLRSRYAVDRGWMTPLLRIRSGPFLHRDITSDYVKTLGRLVDAIAEVSGAPWVVDSSKLPSHALLLGQIPGQDLRILHLVRDSRAVATSWRKQVRAAAEGERELMRYGPVAAALRYDMYNGATSALPRSLPYRRIRYEDAARDPRSALLAALRLLGETSRDDLHFLGPEGAKIEPVHTVDGNPMRFVDGLLKIRRDESWREEMPAWHRRIVTLLTWPWLAAYGYERS